MKLTFKFLDNLLAKKAERKRQLIICKRLESELPIYIDELALYKFMLERQSTSRLLQPHLMEQHRRISERCQRAIQQLETAVHQVGATHRLNLQTYLVQYRVYSIIQPVSYARETHELYLSTLMIHEPVRNRRTADKQWEALTVD